MQLISIGADPEVFLKEGNNISSAIGLIGGSKEAPLNVRGFGLQEDNVLAEFSMEPVHYFGETASFLRHFSDRVEYGISKVYDLVGPKGFTLSKKASHLYTKETLNKWGPAALEFGCDPDFNAYTGDVNPTPDNTSCLRTAGGHIHVGVAGNGAGTEETARAISMAMDLYLGVPSVLLDQDSRRRSMYGKAGAYRTKWYGVEYRSLSNFWIHTERLRKWAAKQTIIAVEAANSIELLHTFVPADMIQDCINTSNKDLARQICQEMNIRVPRIQEEGYATAA